ncbi:MULTISPECIES: GNAT family N-acetyltransferase [Paenibacillus]|uniref:GNAT family N-acetyltransferase n=1 Tax=Paenibacillus TaxID=44249 RepID=UPI0003E2535B|nr:MULTISPECIES: GNAT family protein [Paenibacillus]ETT49306.1 N-acetyltransferase GCN5 [Paenibacillus sp. FSL H8-237]OMC94450.1 GNAT family N-acetyltransferase [Paenibacillus odorifer]OMC99785.1 GNAT family N-acetyltransferase [Paenibacillus odorifer]OMD09861.1 GNAT family N-acetyltransferase [Paenibacillus odorifer]OME27596.1 GNAT family N-acetyltransferase [Paenibacillus odorifer]
MITEIQTKRLKLRKMKLSDSASLFNIWSDPEVTKFMNINSFTDESQAVEMIKILNNLSLESKAIRYSIIELESNRIIGSCGYNSIDSSNAKAEIGYDISKDYWGKGYAPEAIQSLMDYAFNTLNFNRIEAKVEPENNNSIRVLQKLNYTFEGTMRKCEMSKGKFIDLSIFSKLVTE